MRTRGVIGKRIVAVEQVRVPRSRDRQAYTHLQALVLEDGTRITFSVVETESYYGLEAVAGKGPGRTSV